MTIQRKGLKHYFEVSSLDCSKTLDDKCGEYPRFWLALTSEYLFCIGIVQNHCVTLNSSSNYKRFLAQKRVLQSKKHKVN